MYKIVLPAAVAAVTLAMATAAFASNPQHKSGTGVPAEAAALAQPHSKGAPQMTKAAPAPTASRRDMPTSPGGLTTKRLNEMQLERLTGQQQAHP
jgi:hypothetical protein